MIHFLIHYLLELITLILFPDSILLFSVFLQKSFLQKLFQQLFSFSLYIYIVKIGWVRINIYIYIHKYINRIKSLRRIGFAKVFGDLVNPL